MFYLGIIFFLIGAWQAFMNGRLSSIISGVSLILGTIFVFIGNWHAGLFFVFMFATWFLLMQIFRFSTYHKYFFKIAPLLIGYAVLVAFLLRQFNFQNFFWWYLGFSSLYLFINHQKQRGSKDAVDIFAKLDKNIVDSIPEDEAKQHVEKDLSLSFNRTIKYHLLSSIVYILVFAFAFFYFSGSASYLPCKVCIWIIIFIIIFAVISYVVMIKNGNLSFWKKAAKKPDFVYGHLLKDDAWVVDDGISKIEKDKFDGPFLLYIPSIGKTIKFYGKIGKYEDSQKRIEEEL